MQESLFNRASKNFEKYLSDFKSRTGNYLLPKGRLEEYEWQMVNSYLAAEGVALVPYDNSRMQFCFIKDLYGAASKRFEQYVDTFKTNDLAYMFPKSRMTDQQWAQLNFVLAPEGVELVPVDNNQMMLSRVEEFEELFGYEESLDDIMGKYKVVGHNGAQVYVADIPNMGGGNARAMMGRIHQTGDYYADVLNKEGHSGADYIVIAMSKTDAKRLGYKYNEESGVLEENIASVDAVASITENIGRPLAYIGKVPAYIESSADYGVVSGRSVALVKVGDKKIPFYISTGAAGKTGVATGKWEFFGGFQGNWFRKGGSIEEISAHYNSAELKQIASGLDMYVGDLRDTKDVLKSIGRQYLGGIGFVAKMDRAYAIDKGYVNSYVSEENFYDYLQEIRSYLKTTQNTHSVSQELKNGTEKLKGKLLALFKSRSSGDNDIV